MKKAIALLLTVLFLIGAVPLCVGARSLDAMTAERCLNRINHVRFFVGPDNVPYGTDFPAETVFGDVIAIVQWDDAYGYDPVQYGDYTFYGGYLVPEAVFEAEVANYYRLTASLKTALHKLENYKADKGVYDLFAGGIGDSSSYVLRGYKEGEEKNTYEIYGSLVEFDGTVEPDGTMVLGEDYWYQDANFYAINGHVKCLFEVEGETVRILSFERLETLPEPGKNITPAEQSSAINYYSEEGEVNITTEEGVFPLYIRLEAKPVTGTEETAISGVLDKDVNFRAVDFTATLEGESVQPDGAVDIMWFVNPDEWDISKVSVYYYNADGQLEPLPVTIRQDALLHVKVTHFSTYVWAEDGKQILLGDADGNREITTTDARLALQFAAGKIGETALTASAVDVDVSGDVSTTDARVILQYAAGKIGAL